MRPIIGIASAKRVIPGDTTDQFFTIAKGYIDAIVEAGGTPFILPLLNGANAPYEEMLRVVDGILLAGGGDPAPHLFGEPPLAGLGEVDYERDLAEIELIKLAVTERKPIFGICRGLQILNVALGGSLIQDIPRQVPGAYQHNQIGSKQYGCHSVTLESGFIRDIVGKSEILVNSSHHQSIKEVAPGFRATAVSPDGVIEAIESEDGLHVGVQWHPERMCQHDAGMIQLFRAFISKSGQNKTTAKS